MATPENLHANIPDDQRHNPKGFDNAGGGSALGKNLAGELVYDIDYWQAPAIEFVDMALAPPSESNGDRYVLVNLTSSVVHADWDGAVENDIVEFYAAGTVWNALSPFEDLVIRDSNNALEYYFDGTAYQSAGGGGTIGGSGTSGYISRFTSSTDLGDSTIRDNGTTSAVNGAVDAAAQLKVYSTLTQGLEVAQTGTGAIKTGFNVVTSGANASTQYGGIIDVSNGTGEQRGLFIDVNNSGGGAGYGMQSSVVSGAGSNMDAGSFFVSGTNTARNVAGYFDAQNAGAGTAYAIYSNQGQNYLAEEIGIGKLPATSAWQSIDPNTTTKAHINLEGGTADVSSPNDGDLWYNSTAGTLNFYDGTATTDLLAGGGGGGSLWTEDATKGIYFNTASEVVSIGDTATNASTEGAKVYIKADSAFTYALKVDATNDAYNFLVGSSYQDPIWANAIEVGANPASPNFEVLTGGQVEMKGASHLKMYTNAAGTANGWRVVSQGGHYTMDIYNNANTKVYQIGSGTPQNFDNTGKDFTFGAISSIGARVGIKGSGSTSATSSLKIQNSSATTLFEVKDDGTVEAGGSSLGNVSNTGTPANDQLAVWTDANTIEGSSQLIYQSGAFQVASGGGYIYLYNSGYMRMKKNTTANTLTIDPAYGNQTRSQIGTSAGADLFLQSGTQTPLYFDTSGNISVGQNKSLGTTHSARFEITGSGSTAATIGLNVRNSAAATNFKVQDDGVSVFKSFTVATLPTAVAGGYIYVSDETGGATMAFSDGTNWRRVQDRAIVS